MRRRGWWVLPAALLALLATVGLLALPAAAAQQPRADLTVSPAGPAAPNGDVTLSGRDFGDCLPPVEQGEPAPQPVTIKSDLGFSGGTVRAGGSFAVPGTIPADAEPGEYTITATCPNLRTRQGEVSDFVQLVVVAPPEVPATPEVPTGPTDVVVPGQVVPSTGVDVPDTVGPGADTMPAAAIVAAVIGALALVALLALAARTAVERRHDDAGRGGTLQVRHHRGVTVGPTVRRPLPSGTGVRLVPRTDAGHRTCTDRDTRA